MLAKSITTTVTAIAISLVAHCASANLLINPTRVNFDNADRTADVTLINTSQTTNTYRIDWAEKKAIEAGGYEDLTPEQAQSAHLPIASGMIRYSPRQVTLKPGERQTVKLAIRRPQSLANGEYRSHMQFTALPPGTSEKTEDKNSPALAFKILLSFAIPVVVVQGPIQYEMAMDNAWITYSPSKKDGAVNVTLSRTGAHSVIGNINAYWTPNGGKEQLIAKIGDYNFWPETKKVNVPLGWVGAPFASSDGKLRIVYEGTKNFHGKVFVEKTINIQGSAIKMAN